MEEPVPGMERHLAHDENDLTMQDTLTSGSLYHEGSSDTSCLESSTESIITDEDVMNYYIDFDDILGKDIAIFSYLYPESLFLFKVSPADTLESLYRFVKYKLDYKSQFHRLAFLLPNEIHPQDIGDVVTIKPGTSLLVLPKMLRSITLVINQLDKYLEMEIDIVSHVFTIKQMIEAEQGYPVTQQDLLYDGHCLENQHRLYQYQVRNYSVIELCLQYQYNIVISVKTFWKTVYDLFVDPCMQLSDVMEIALKRCMSSEHNKTQITTDFIIPRHLLIFTHKGKILHSGSTLGSHNIQDSDVINLTTIGRYHKVNLRTIDVNMEDDRAARIVVSQFDTWSIVALHMHGITAIPIDKLQLSNRNILASFAKAIGTSNISASDLTMAHPSHNGKTSRTKLISVVVALGSSICETITCATDKTIGYIKERLEQVGVPNAKTYHLTTKYGKLPDSLELKDILTNHLHSTLQVALKLEYFPFFIHLPNNSKQPITIHVSDSMDQVMQQIQKKTRLHLTKHNLILAGNKFTDSRNTEAYDSELCIGTTLFMVKKQNTVSFYVHCDTTVTKLTLKSQNQTTHQIKQVIWKAERLPSSCLQSLQTFFTWHFSLVPFQEHQRGPVNMFSGKLLASAHQMAMQQVNHLNSWSKSNDSELVIQSPDSKRCHPTFRTPKTSGIAAGQRKSIKFQDTLPRPNAAGRQRKLALVDGPMIIRERQCQPEGLSSQTHWHTPEEANSMTCDSMLFSGLPQIFTQTGGTRLNSSSSTAARRQLDQNLEKITTEETKSIVQIQNNVVPWSYLT